MSTDNTTTTSAANLSQFTSRNKKVLSGLREDIEMLFTKFSDLQSVRFPDFSRCWRDMSFSYVFTFKLNESELREFIEEAFLIALDSFNSTITPERAISTLYLLYCLYANQPLEPKIPIKLTLPQFKLFRTLYEESRLNEHIDACYVWLKLISLGAFHFVARERPIGPTYIKKFAPTSSSSSSSSSWAVKSSMEFELATNYEPFMVELKKIHQDYCRMKQSLEGGDVSQVKDLNLVKDNLFKEYTKITEKAKSGQL